MKALIVSDTHRKDDNLERVIEEQLPLDLLIHLGDAEGSEDALQYLVNEGCEVYAVRGNNDFFSDLEGELEVDLGPHRLFLTHGHYYNVSLGVEGLAEEAAERDCDVAMYGHTHRPYLDQTGPVTVLNPGSLSYPRQEGRQSSYMIMEMDAEGTLSFHTYYLFDRK